MKKIILSAIKVAVSVGLIAWTTYHLDWSALLLHWSEVNILWIMLSLSVLTVSYFAGAWQWQMIMRSGGIMIRYPKTLGYYYVGLFFNNFLISGMGGDILRVYDIHKHTDRPEHLSPAVAAVFLDRLTGLMMLIFLAGVSGIFLLGQGESTRLFFSILGLFGIWFIGFVILFNKAIADRTVKPIFKMLPEKIYSRLQNLYHEVHKFRREPQMLIRVFSVSLLVQSLRIFSIFCIGRALGDQSSLAYYLLFVPLISLVSSLPISIGGTGPREQTTVFLFRKIGMPAEIAFSIGLLTYVISITSAIPGGFVFMLRKNRLT